MEPKVISEYSYNIMKICKANGVNIENLLQEYIKEVYWNSSYLTYPELYCNLIKVILEICSEKEIKNILIYDIHECFKNKIYESGKLKDLPINHEDLCKMLINKLTFIQVRENDEDLFLVKTKTSVMTIDDYEKSSDYYIQTMKRIKKENE